MKRLLLATIALSGAMACFAQDSTGTEKEKSVNEEKVDTIRVGGMVIIKKKGEGDHGHNNVVIVDHHRRKPSNISTNWIILDLGFANVNDNTNYASAEAQAFAPGITKENLKLKSKSNNVNIWFFMQRFNLVKHVLNLKYGLGLELNNYHFDDDHIVLSKNPTVITRDPNFHPQKNKLAADYVTVPFMLNVNFTPGRERGFGFSGGVSAGYLYSSRQKFKIDGDVDKTHDDFDLREWRISYIGEVNLGPVKLYGSYAIESMWEKGLDQTPYNVGIRLSHW
jgi:hypothetical protein